MSTYVHVVAVASHSRYWPTRKWWAATIVADRRLPFDVRRTGLALEPGLRGGSADARDAAGRGVPGAE